MPTLPRFRVGLVTAAATLPGLASAAFAAGATLLADLAPGAAHGVPTMYAAVFDDRLYFRGSDDGTTFDLWVYDGEDPPAQVPGGQGLDPLDPVVWQGELYFRGVSGGDAELWRYDGVTAPELAVDIRASGSGDPRLLFPFGELLCFQTTTATGIELGCWDGQTAPDIYGLGPGQVDGLPLDFAIFDDRLVFNAADAVATRRLFAFDGVTPPVEIEATPGFPGNPRQMTVADGVLYFWAAAPTGTRLWKWDPVEPTPVAFGPTMSFPKGMTLFRGRPHLLVGQGMYGVWRVDGEALVQRTAEPHTVPDLEVTLAGNVLYYRQGTDFRAYCGTDSMSPVVGLWTGGDGPRAGRNVVFRDRLYFAARTSATSGDEIWSFPVGAIFCDGFFDSDFGPWAP